MKKEMKKFARDVKAISPVIATLMLVLIAVASASAFYIWQSGWQEDAQDTMGDSDVANQLLISGSTTVTPFMEVAAAAFMDENPTYKVTIQGIGSGAGKSATLQEKCDIGMVSAALSDEDIENGLVQTVIGYDGIVMFVSADTWDALEVLGVEDYDRDNMTADIMKGLYSGTISHLGELADELNDTLSNGADSGAEITTYDRAEESGTEEGFCKAGGMGKQLPSGAYEADESVNGNPGMIAAVKDEVGAIGFTSFGMVAEDDEVVYFGYDDVMPSASNIKSGALGEGGYGASRLLVVCTLGEPVGDVAFFIEFITNPENNMDFCAAVGYVSII